MLAQRAQDAISTGVDENDRRFGAEFLTKRTARPRCVSCAGDRRISAQMRRDG
jgi:hypothetical protein